MATDPARTAPPIRRTLDRLVYALVAIAVLNGILIGSAVFSAYRVAESLFTVNGPAADSNGRLLQTVTDAETGLRGYAATGDPVFLQPYDGGRTRSTEQLTRLSRTLKDDDGLRTRLATQQRTVREWWSYAEKTRLAVATGNPADLQRGKRLFDQVRSVNASIDEELTRRRLADREDAYRRLGWSLAVTGVLTVVIAMLSWLLGRRTAEKLSSPVVELRRVMRARRTGLDTGEQTEAADPNSGPQEVRELAAEFNRLSEMRERLREEQRQSIRMSEVALSTSSVIRGSEDPDRFEAVVALLSDGFGAEVVVFGGNPDDGWTSLPRLSSAGRMSADEIVSCASARLDALEIEDVLRTPAPDADVAALLETLGWRSVITRSASVLGRTTGLTAIGHPEPHEWTAIERRGFDDVVAQGVYSLSESEQIRRATELDRQKRDFMATVSHELRTPLTSVAGYLELLGDGDLGAMSAQQEKAIGVVDRNVARLRGLIEDLLILNRIDAGRGPNTRIAAPVAMLLADVLQAMEPIAARGGVDVEAAPVPADLFIRVDVEQMERVLVNVISNAIKFTPAGGRVTIDQTSTPDTVVVRVTDTGVGIPANEVDQIGTRFFRASNVRGGAMPGTGLGMAIISSILEAHGGRLEVESTLGVGTTMRLTIPRCLDPKADDTAATAPAQRS